MPRTSKIPRYNEFNSAQNAFGPRAQDPASWRSLLDPEAQLNLELGCGKAEVTLALAQKYSNQNFIGVDLKADRLWRASKDALEQKLDNVAFVQSDVLRLRDFISDSTVAQIWLTHPDPYPKDRHAKHRMLNRNFLDIYAQVLQPGGVVRMKTDNRSLFDWALELLSRQPDIRVLDFTYNLYADKSDEDILIKTNFTNKYLAKNTPINYLACEFIQTAGGPTRPDRQH